MRDPRVLLKPILAMHDRVRDEIVHAVERAQLDALAAVDRDTIYAIDVVGEAAVTRFAADLAREHAFVLVGEGLR